MYLFESSSNRIVIVDIQPEYQDYIPFSIESFSDYVENSGFSYIHFLYNGKHTLNMIEEDKYKFWLIRNGFSQDTIARASFFDKGYAFFRDCMDADIELTEYITRFVRYMWINDIHDSRDIDDEVWDDINYPKIERLLRETDRLIYIPSLMDYLHKNVGDGFELVGGGVDECLKEVVIALDALEKSYEINEKWTYP